jgi:hypothetical protein
MPHIDPNQQPDPGSPIVEHQAQPTVIDPLTGLVNPHVTDPGYRAVLNPFHYLAAFVLVVLGMWGLLAMSGYDDPAESDNVAYVEQTLEPVPSPFSVGAPQRATASRVAEDRTRDGIRDVRRHDIMASSDDAINETTSARDALDGDEVASVNLSEPLPAPALVAEPASSPAGAEVAARPARQIAVQDIDYSDMPMVALGEAEFQENIDRLDADIASLEPLAREAGQLTGLEILKARLSAVKASIETTKGSRTESHRLLLTRHLSEVRDEFAEFQTDVRVLVGKVDL